MRATVKNFSKYYLIVIQSFRYSILKNADWGPKKSKVPKTPLVFHLPLQSCCPLSWMLPKEERDERMRHSLYWHLLKNELNKMSNAKDEACAQPPPCAGIHSVLISAAWESAWFELKGRSLVLVTTLLSKSFTRGQRAGTERLRHARRLQEKQRRVEAKPKGYITWFPLQEHIPGIPGYLVKVS